MKPSLMKSILKYKHDQGMIKMIQNGWIKGGARILLKAWTLLTKQRPACRHRRTRTENEREEVNILVPIKTYLR